MSNAPIQHPISNPSNDIVTVPWALYFREVTDGVNAVAGSVAPSGNLGVSIYDRSTNAESRVTANGHMIFTQIKRIFGRNNMTTTELFTTTTSGSGSNTASNGTSVFATGTTANSSVDVKTDNKVRFQFGTVNYIRMLNRFGDTGTANNVREIGLYIDANNALGFRLSGTTFSVFIKRVGVETVVNSGSFNNGGSTATSTGTWTVDTNFHGFEIEYYPQKVIFRIDGTAIHHFETEGQSLISSLVGKPYVSNVNSGGSTTNVTMENIGFGAFSMSDTVNNPNYYCIDGVAETRTLKSGGGTLQTISITKSSSGGTGTLTIYDNTAGSGTKIAIFDTAATSSVGVHQFGINGVNFYNGLTYVTSGTLTNGAITICWE